jgi:hypothetical protein
VSYKRVDVCSTSFLPNFTHFDGCAVFPFPKQMHGSIRVKIPEDNTLCAVNNLGGSVRIDPYFNSFYNYQADQASKKHKYDRPTP